MNDDHEITQGRSAWWKGIPSVVILLLITLPVLLEPFLRSTYHQRYRDLVVIAAENGDSETARLFLPKAISLSDHDDPQVSFIQAKTDGEQGRLEDAKLRMLSLAEAGTEVSAAAHLWLARRMWEDQKPSASLTGTADDIRQHLLAVIELNETSEAAMDAHAILGEVLRNNPSAVRKHLEKAIERRPEAAYLLAEACEELEDSEQAAMYYRRAQNYFSRQLSEDPRDTAKVIQMAATCRKLGNFLQAEQVLQAAIRKAVDSRAEYLLRSELAESWVEQSRLIGEDRGVTDMTRLRSLLLIGRAVDTCPESEVALSAFADLVSRIDEIDEIEFLEERAADHFLTILLRALQLMKSDRPVAAESAFRQALEEMQRFPAVLNRLTWFQMNNSDLQTAEQLCDQIERIYGSSRNRNFFCLTLGRLNMMRGNCEAAVLELREAVDANPQDVEAATYLKMAMKAAKEAAN